ncbi:MAG: nucleoside hydrolase [Lachnospiraceae bacterium]|nr:nucleoside hydrolase [Lachnospiraceae bacterium]
MINGFEYEVPDHKKIRVIVDTDAACEADDPFAIVHALLSPKLIVKGITAEHFKEKGSMESSYREIETILTIMDMEIPFFRGQDGPLDEDDRVSEASQFIVEEARKEDDKPLFILCQGAVTNVAKAILTESGIKDRMSVIWIGTHGEGPIKAPFSEFNAANDIEAANILLQSGVRLWLVPSSVYSTVNIGISEIQRRIRPCGNIGEHLFDNLIRYNMLEGAGWTQGESWSLGDSPAIAIAINPGCGRYYETKAPLVLPDTSSAVKEDNPVIRIYKDVDSRYILEDLIAKLELFTDKR